MNNTETKADFNAAKDLTLFLKYIHQLAVVIKEVSKEAEDEITYPLTSNFLKLQKSGHFSPKF